VATFAALIELESRGGKENPKKHPNGVVIRDSNILESTYVLCEETANAGKTGAEEALTALRSLLSGSITNTVPIFEVQYEAGTRKLESGFATTVYYLG
jgi:hypothetical protein